MPSDEQERQGMKHCKRVLTALNHEEPDCCTMQISFTPEFASGLSTPRRKGALILSPTRHVRLDTPIESFRAMVRPIRKTPYGAFHA